MPVLRFRDKTGRSDRPNNYEKERRYLLVSLELELDSEASVEGTLVARVGVTRDTRGPDSSRLAEINVQCSDRALLVLVQTEQRALIGQVEQVSRQTDLGSFRKPNR